MSYSLKTAEDQEFAQKCEQYSAERGIPVLPEEVLAKFFVMPRELRVAHVNYTTILHPLLGSRSKKEKLKLLGHYATNNGIVCLVYRDGRTLLHPGYDIIPELRKAGYCEGEFNVPLSGGDSIMNGGLLNQWLSLKERP